MLVYTRSPDIYTRYKITITTVYISYSQLIVTLLLNCLSYVLTGLLHLLFGLLTGLVGVWPHPTDSLFHPCLHILYCVLLLQIVEALIPINQHQLGQTLNLHPLHHIIIAVGELYKLGVEMRRDIRLSVQSGEIELY